MDYQAISRGTQIGPMKEDNLDKWRRSCDLALGEGASDREGTLLSERNHAVATLWSVAVGRLQHTVCSLEAVHAGCLFFILENQKAARLACNI